MVRHTIGVLLVLMFSKFFYLAGDALPVDLVRAPDQLARALDLAPSSLTLSLGVVNGRGVWRTDLDCALAMVRNAVKQLGPERVQVAPSCSLLHVPLDRDVEPKLPAPLRVRVAWNARSESTPRHIERALRTFEPEQSWVNPDCGLKTRAWSEVSSALANMVEAARVVRAHLTGVEGGSAHASEAKHTNHSEPTDTAA